MTTIYGLYCSHHYTYITNYISSWCRSYVCNFLCTASTPVFLTSLLHGLPWFTNCIKPRFYTVPFKIKFNQLLISIEKLSPLQGFEPRTSLVTSRYATNWAILAWILDTTLNLTLSKLFNEISLNLICSVIIADYPTPKQDKGNSFTMCLVLYALYFNFLNKVSTNFSSLFIMNLSLPPFTHLPLLFLKPNQTLCVTDSSGLCYWTL